MNELHKTIQHKLNTIGNIVFSDVVDSLNEDNNKIIRYWSSPISHKYYHNEVLTMIDGFDSQRGVNVAGHRAYFLKNYGVLLN